MHPFIRNAAAIALVATVACAQMTASAEPADVTDSRAYKAEVDTVAPLDLAGVQEAARAAEAAHTASAGKVLDDAVRAELTTKLTAVAEDLEAMRWLVVWHKQSPASARDDAEAELEQLRTEVAEHTTKVEAAVTAWEAEQARLAAEAAARAAEEAARAARASAPRGGGAPAGPRQHTESMWTSGGQAEIDACRGSVNVSNIAGFLGAGFYAAEHWSCGGRAWGGVGVGDVVTFSGHGQYRVAGIQRGLAHGQSSARDISYGYDGYYQTCIGGNNQHMAVWLLERVG